ncbi:MAG: aminoglycoside 6-adenylyltransferase [Anaerolineales bacterium]|nr:aminoglycoside 6-adenylyltransferase [Anaerolineales bacterium]
MRSEQEMLELIIQTARDDERIRAVVMNGSRANPNAPRDFFQDYDIVYLVTEMAPFVRNHEWIKRFGEMMILQLPVDMQDPPPEPGDGYCYLMQFADGNRIDLGINPVEKPDEFVQDSHSIILLDKDGRFPDQPPPSDRDYLPKPPTAKAFDDCTNEFWWVSPYVAKGLWRGEIPYAKGMLDGYVRPQLMKMLEWYIGMQTNFSVSPGKLGKYFHKYLEPELYELLMQTYSDADPAHTWDALLAMCSLFRKVAIRVADYFGFEYPYGDDERVSAHLSHVRRLPSDAQEMY